MRAEAVKVAYYSPLPPSRSGIADYSALLIPALAERVEVVVAKPGRLHRAPKADLALYHVGNDPNEHGWIVDALRRRPGVVVLHEFVLHHLVSGITLARGDVEGYAAALERDAGPSGRTLAYSVADGRIPPLWESRPQDFPLAREVLDPATGLIVHSRHVEERARAAGYEGPIWQVPMPAWPIPQVEPAAIEGEPLLGTFGHVNESKRIPQLFEAFERLRARRPGARLLVVGVVVAALRRPRAARGSDPQGLRSRGRALEPAGRHRRGRLATLADHGRDLGGGDPRALARQASRRQRRRLVLGAARLRRRKGARRRGRDRAAGARPGAGGDELEMARAALELARTEHNLGRVADLYAAALREAVSSPVAA